MGHVGFAELSDVPLGFGGSSINHLLELPCGAGRGFLFPHQEEIDIFTFSPEVLGPLQPKDGCVQASLCVSTSRVIFAFPLGAELDTCRHHGWPTGWIFCF